MLASPLSLMQNRDITFIPRGLVLFSSNRWQFDLKYSARIFVLDTTYWTVLFSSGQVKTIHHHLKSCVHVAGVAQVVQAGHPRHQGLPVLHKPTISRSFRSILSCSKLDEKLFDQLESDTRIHQEHPQCVGIGALPSENISILILF